MTSSESSERTCHQIWRGRRDEIAVQVRPKDRRFTERSRKAGNPKFAVKGAIN